MFTNILVPTDLTKKSVYALQVACDIAQRSHGKINLLHLIKGTESDDPKDQKEVLKLSQQQLREFKEKVACHDIEVDLELQFASQENLIAEVISEKKCDLLVMGGRTFGDLEEIFYESKVLQTVRNSKFPLLAINDEVMGSFNPERVLVPLDFSEKLDDTLIAFDTIKNLYDPEFTLLYLNTPSHFASTKTLDQKLAEFKHSYPFFDTAELVTINCRNREKGILEYAEDTDQDLIVLMTENISRWQTIFRRSLAESIINSSLRPVLTFNIKTNH